MVTAGVCLHDSRQGRFTSYGLYLSSNAAYAFSMRSFSSRNLSMIGYETTKLHKFILLDMNDSLYTKGYQYTVTLVQASVCDCFSIVEDLHVQL